MTTTLLAVGGAGPANAEERPKTWIITDLSDKTLPGPNKEGTLNDPDDHSAMAGYLLMANEFDTLGIVVASTHRAAHASTPDQSRWADGYFGEAFRAELANLNDAIGGYPEHLPIYQSAIKSTSERYSTRRNYFSLQKYESIARLRDAAESLTDGDLLNVLCWGSLTEPAIFVNHCIATGRTGLLEKTRFIAHWTNSSLSQGTPRHPERVANCSEDAMACSYLKRQAAAGLIDFRECGAIGQSAIVRCAPDGADYYEEFKVGRLGTLFVTGKFAHGRVDHSDAATYWVLLPGYGVHVDDIAADGSNAPERETANREAFCRASGEIHDELRRRAILAAGRPTRRTTDLEN
ncbi:MAG: nucleoside hydrolase-like domain-containing protein [Planctomycetota bacterium]